jgi:hypothetical protein
MNTHNHETAGANRWAWVGVAVVLTASAILYFFAQNLAEATAPLREGMTPEEVNKSVRSTFLLAVLR